MQHYLAEPCTIFSVPACVHILPHCNQFPSQFLHPLVLDATQIHSAELGHCQSLHGLWRIHHNHVYGDVWVLCPWMDLLQCGWFLGEIAFWSLVVLPVERWVVFKSISNYVVAGILLISIMPSTCSVPILIGWSRYIAEGTQWSCGVDYYIMKPDINKYFVNYMFLVHFTIPLTITSFCFSPLYSQRGINCPTGPTSPPNSTIKYIVCS